MTEVYIVYKLTGEGDYIAFHKTISTNGYSMDVYGLLVDGAVVKKGQDLIVMDIKNKIADVISFTDIQNREGIYGLYKYRQGINYENNSICNLIIHNGKYFISYPREEHVLENIVVQTWHDQFIDFDN